MKKQMPMKTPQQPNPDAKAANQNRPEGSVTSQPVMLVTGSAKRIGAAIIRQAHHLGYRVIIHYHHSGHIAAQLANELNTQRPHSAATVQADLAVVNDQTALQDFVTRVIHAFGQLDVVVHNASRFYPSPLGQITHSQWDELFLTNAKAPLMLSQAFLPHLSAQQGNIVSILDIHADGKPFNDYPVYNMAKAAHRMMVQSLALDLAPSIRVNGVAPGANIFPDANSDQAIDPQTQQQICDSIPLQRIGSPEEIAEAVLYLCHASYITGQIIAVDGGRSLTLQGSGQSSNMFEN